MTMVQHKRVNITSLSVVLAPAFVPIDKTMDLIRKTPRDCNKMAVNYYVKQGWAWIYSQFEPTLIRRIRKSEHRHIAAIHHRNHSMFLSVAEEA